MDTAGKLMHVGILTLYLQLPGSGSLKQKRSRLKPLLARLHKEFNVSVAEIGNQDVWQEAVIACTFISNSSKHTQRYLQKVVHWVDNSWLDVDLVDDRIEVIF
jgi:uncharacterized protein YlxP (DUF503 family)